MYAGRYSKTYTVLGISVGESPNVSGQHKTVCKIRSIVKGRMIFKNKGRNYRQLVIANIMAYGFSKSTRGASLGNPRPDCLRLLVVLMSPRLGRNNQTKVNILWLL